MQLSTSALDLFANCKRCFYLDRKLKAPRPKGIFPSLPGGVDGILKSRLDAYRGALPPQFEGVEQLQGWRLFGDRGLLDIYRAWNAKDALKWKPGTVDSAKKENVLVGGLDDVLEHVSNGLVAPCDYKTKGSEPCQEDCEKYYQRQLDIYAVLLSTKYQVADFGTLFYFWPVEDENGLVVFECRAFFLDVSVERGKALVNEAWKLLESNELPPSDPGCEYCKAHAVRSDATKKAMVG